MKKLIIAVLLAVSVSATSAEKVYKWVDENGQIHYSSQKPDGEEVKTIKLKKEPKVVVKKEVEPEETGAKAEGEVEEPVDPKAEKEAQKQMAKADAANRKKQCDAAKKNLNALNSSTRVATLDEKTGARTIMSDEQRVKAFQQANKAVKDNCK